MLTSILPLLLLVYLPTAFTKPLQYLPAYTTSNLLDIPSLPSYQAGPATFSLTAQVLNSIASIDTAATALTTTITTLNPDHALTYVTALELHYQSSDLTLAISAATKTATASSEPWNSTESFDIAEAVSILHYDISSLLDNLLAHDRTFGGLSESVEAGLKRQKEAMREFGAAVGPKLASPFGAVVLEIVREVLRRFDEAGDVFVARSVGLDREMRVEEIDLRMV